MNKKKTEATKLSSGNITFARIFAIPFFSLIRYNQIVALKISRPKCLC